jgi:predicted RNase H-like nuclease
MSDRASVAVGVDGCKGGWFAVKRDRASGTIEVAVWATFAQLLHWAPAPAVIGVDMPIGLATGESRDCDTQARKRLGWPRATSVFSPPVRVVLGASSYEDACARNRAAVGRAMSKQAFNILPKIAELDAVLQTLPRQPQRVFEVHPELAFMALAQSPSGKSNGRRGGEKSKGLVEPKRTAAGHARRLALLPTEYRVAVDQALTNMKRAACAADDVLDAFAVLWSAERCVKGDAIAIAEKPEIDAVGLEMNIRY